MAFTGTLELIFNGIFIIVVTNLHTSNFSALHIRCRESGDNAHRWLPAAMVAPTPVRRFCMLLQLLLLEF